MSNSSYLGSLIIHLTTNIQNLKSCYNSHLISPTRLLLSVKQLKSVEEVKDKVSYGAMVLCVVVELCLDNDVVVELCLDIDVAVVVVVVVVVVCFDHYSI